MYANDKYSRSVQLCKYNYITGHMLPEIIYKNLPNCSKIKMKALILYKRRTVDCCCFHPSITEPALTVRIEEVMVINVGTILVL